jgi:hypothetical protein
MPTDFHIRPAEPRDVPAILGLIRELAEFEQLLHLVQATPEKLQAQLFGPRPAAECVVVDAPADHAARAQQVHDQDHAAPLVAFALFFTNFSTFLAQPGLYLEDLYVQPAQRGHGLGKALLQHLGALAVERGCGRFEWSVLDWNETAIGFYRRMGATVMPDWRICRITGQQLQAYARG